MKKKYSVIVDVVRIFINLMLNCSTYKNNVCTNSTVHMLTIIMLS